MIILSSSQILELCYNYVSIMLLIIPFLVRKYPSVEVCLNRAFFLTYIVGIPHRVTAMNTGMHYLFTLVFSFSPDKYPVVELLGQYGSSVLMRAILYEMQGSISF